MSDDPDFEYLIIDSTIVRAHQHASGAKRGLKIRPSDAREAGLSTKIHLLCADWMPCRFRPHRGPERQRPASRRSSRAAPAEFVIAMRLTMPITSEKLQPRKAPKP